MAVPSFVYWHAIAYLLSNKHNILDVCFECILHCETMCMDYSAVTHVLCRLFWDAVKYGPYTILTSKQTLTAFIKFGACHRLFCFVLSFLSKEKNITLLSGLVIIISLRVLFCPACITFIFSIICLQQTDNAVHGAWMIPVSPKVIYPNKQKLGFCVCIHLLPITPVCNMYSINISSKIKVIRLLAKAKL